jgi:hypothetical protein
MVWYSPRLRPSRRGGPIARSFQWLLRAALLIVLIEALAVGFGSARGASPKVAVSLGSALPAPLAASQGRSYFVDGSGGNDHWAGTKERPWRTVGKALRSVPLSGSTILLHGGTYPGEFRWSRAGNPLNPVTLRAYRTGRVHMTGVAGKDLPAIWVYRGSGLRVEGFDIHVGSADGIRIEDSHDIEIRRCNVHHTGAMGVLVVGTGKTAPTGNRNIQLWGNYFHDNGGAFVQQDPYWAKGTHSVYWGAVSDSGDGIDHTTVGGIIANNVFYDQPYGRQLQLGSQVDGTIVTNNTFNRAYQADPAAGDAVVFYGEGTRFDTRNVLVVNNIIVDNAHHGITGSGGNAVMQTNVVRNNLAWKNRDGNFEPLYNGQIRLFTLRSNITGVAPRFMRSSSGDFRLRSSSPAIGRSIPAYTPATDLLGHARKARPDLGALEHTSG